VIDAQTPDRPIDGAPHSPIAEPMSPFLSPPPPLPSIVVDPAAPKLESPDRPSASRSGWAIARQRSVVHRAIKTSLVVGSILVGINHGDALMRRDLPPDRLAKIGLTYLVPYLVATFASVSTLRELSQPARSTAAALPPPQD